MLDMAGGSWGPVSCAWVSPRTKKFECTRVLSAREGVPAGGNARGLPFESEGFIRSLQVSVQVLSIQALPGATVPKWVRGARIGWRRYLSSNPSKTSANGIISQPERSCKTARAESLPNV